MNEPVATWYPAAEPSESLNPNKYAGDYLISQVLILARDEFFLINKLGGVKIFERFGIKYCCPLIDQTPPSQYQWNVVGRKYSRDVYREAA